MLVDHSGPETAGRMGGDAFQGGREPRDGLTTARLFDHRLKSTLQGSPRVGRGPGSDRQDIAFGQAGRSELRSRRGEGAWSVRGRQQGERA